LEARFQQANQNVEALLKAENIALATQQNLAAIDDFFVQALNAQYEAALKAEDKDRQQKLEQIIAVIQQATLPPGAELIQKLIDAPDEEARKKFMEENREAITPELVETLTGLLVQLEAGENKEMAEKVRAIYRAAVRMSMQSSMKAG
jgi:primosomal protein N'